MRILQLIDTLSPGGAERMAVNYANALAEKIEFSGLVSTRLEGDLQNRISTKISFRCLYKKHALDIPALLKLRHVVKKNRVQIIHAHGTTFFTAFLLKCIYPPVKIIYHEHLGNRANEKFSQNIVLISCSLFFTKIIVVNPELKVWCEKFLWCKNVFFLPNFAHLSQDESTTTTLKGNDGKRIVMLANLKHPKNHFFVVKAFSKMNLISQGWTLHLVGKIYDDDYFNAIDSFVSNEQLTNAIFFYNSCADIKNILSQADIGILASTSEGFPVAILEYAQMKLPVMSTTAGYCSALIKNGKTGFLFDPNNIENFKTQLQCCVSNTDLSNNLANNLHQICEHKYSENAVILQLLAIYSK